MDEDDSLSWDNTIFRDEHVFELDYRPETFKQRDSQMETLKYALRPAVRGSRPLNVMIRGPPGTGKTTAVWKLFDELQGMPDVRAVRVNCQIKSSRYSVFKMIYEGILEHKTPPAGIQFQELIENITQQLINEEEVLIVALDDVNYLFYESEASETLYSLIRAHEEYSGAKIGVIVVSSDLDLDIIDSLDPRVRSVFRPEEVYFPAYEQSEIADILRDRANRGFRDGVVDSQAIDCAAAHTADAGGDLRVGIDLLRRAGMTAEMRGSMTVERKDVDTAFQKAKQVHLSRHLEGLTDSEKCLLRLVANEQREWAGDLYPEFEEVTGLGYTRYSEIINKLEQLGLIEVEYREGEDGNHSRSLSLGYSQDAILDRL